MTFSGVRLDDVLGGRDNNLNLIRMIAAMLVLVSHAFPITLGAGAEEPLYATTGQTLGHYAVAIFFVISGLLIARSFDRRQSMVHFTLSRILRLYPALLVVLVLTVLAGFVFTTLPASDYASARGTWTYVPANLSLAFLQYPLPGVFENNPYGPPINGSLWTLVYEVACYGGVVLIGIFGVLRNRWLALAALLAVTAFHFAVPQLESQGWNLGEGLGPRIRALALLTFPFMLGSFAYVWREHIRLSGPIAALLWLVALILLATPLAASFLLVAIGYSTLWLGLVPKTRLLAYNQLGDYSYGVYIYAFPVQQAMVFAFPGMSAAQNMLAALPVTLAFAAASWFLVEKHALDMARPGADRLLPAWQKLTRQQAA